MKSFTLIIGVYILFSLNSCSQDFKKLNSADVDAKKIKISQKFANEYFTALKNGSYYQFKEEAIEILKNQLTEQNQKAIYQQLKDQFGDFKSLEYAETWIQSSNPSLNIFRFKGDFEKSNKKLEIRVVLNESDKISGFWIKPWSDMLK
jgi:16S rRNA C967 or C1407 C5-methylase (RsmB/RsmF family)